MAGDSLSIEVRNGALEQAERAEGVDLGLRVLIGRRQACVSSSDIRDATIAAMAERAVAMAREAPEDPWCGLAAPEELARGWDAAALDLEDPEPLPAPDALQAAALAAEAAALAVPGVSKMDAAGAGWSATRMHLAATNGFSGGYARTGHSIQAVAICGEGTAMERDYAFESRSHRADLPDPAEIGRLAGERTAARAGAGKPPTGAWPVLYDERVASGLIGHLVQAINGAAVARGASWLKDAMGEPVLPRRHRPRRGPASARASAARGPSTARGCPRPGARSSRTACSGAGSSTSPPPASSASGAPATPAAAPRRRPRPSAGNLTLTQGTRHPRRRSWPRWAPGLLVTALMGASINPTTGDYSRGASGFWVENGARSCGRSTNAPSPATSATCCARSARPTTPCRTARAWCRACSSRGW